MRGRSLSLSKLSELNQREIYIHDQRHAIIKAVNQAVKQKAVEISKRLLGVLDEETISQTTGLSIEEIERLKDAH